MNRILQDKTGYFLIENLENLASTTTVLAFTKIQIYLVKCCSS
jgi:hypothetical protein